MQIGEILREAREANHLTLDEIQEETKIQKRYLVAIEQDDFHALPGRFYARAFIKEYAQAVGLDPIEVLAEFDEDRIQTDQEETVQYTRLNRSKRPKAARGSSFLSFLPSVIVVILVIGIIFIAWTLYQQKLQPNEGDQENQSEEDQIIRNVEENEDGTADSGNSAENEAGSDENDDETADDPSQTEAFSIVETGTGGSPLSTLDFTYANDQAEVTFDVSATSYVELKGADGSVYFQGMMEPEGKAESFDVAKEEKIYFNIGNAAGLTVKVNDVELTYPIDPNETVHQKLWINLQPAG